MKALSELDQIDLEILAAIQRERMAEMRQAAWDAYRLGAQTEADDRRKRHLLLALCCAVPVLLLAVRVVAG